MFRGQRPSLLVVLGNGPVYLQAQDRRALQRKVFTTPAALVVSRSWQTLPVGAAGYITDNSHNTWTKFFPEQETFASAYKPVRVVFDGTQGVADVFHGNDVYGWPPPPVPEYWSPEGRGTEALLNSFPQYDPSGDVFLLKKAQPYFEDYAGYWTFSQPITANAVNNTSIFRIDVVGRPQQAKYFPPVEEFTRVAQQITANSLNFFPIYVPGTDVTRLRRSDKTFIDYVEFARAQPITANALNFFPIYNPGTDVTRLRRSAVYFVPPIEFTDRVQVPYLQTLGFGGNPPILPGQFPIPDFTGIGWYHASHLIIKAGLVQVFPPIRIESNVYPNYLVLAQYPVAGTFVSPYTNVQLTVSVHSHLLAPTFDWIPLFRKPGT